MSILLSRLSIHLIMDDWEHYGKMTAECGVQVQIVGDDLLLTNLKVRS